MKMMASVLFFADGLDLPEHGLPVLVGVVDLKIESDVVSRGFSVRRKSRPESIAARDEKGGVKGV